MKKILYIMLLLTTNATAQQLPLGSSNANVTNVIAGKFKVEKSTRLKDTLICDSGIITRSLSLTNSYLNSYGNGFHLASNGVYGEFYFVPPQNPNYTFTFNCHLQNGSRSMNPPDASGTPAYSVNGIPTNTSTGDIAIGLNSAASKDSTINYKVTIDKLVVNHNTDNGTPDAAIKVTGTLNAGVSASGHGFRDETVFKRNGFAYNAYDAAAQIPTTATGDFDHLVDFQSRSRKRDAGNLNNLYSFYSEISIEGGNVTNAYTFYASTFNGSGTATNAYGLYVPTFSKGSTLSQAIRTGTNDVSFGGKLGLGLLSFENPLEMLDVRGNARFTGSLKLYNSTYTNTISQETLTADRTQVIPNKSGTFAMTSDIPSAIDTSSLSSRIDANTASINSSVALVMKNKVGKRVQYTSTGTTTTGGYLAFYGCPAGKRAMLGVLQIYDYPAAGLSYSYVIKNASGVFRLSSNANVSSGGNQSTFTAGYIMEYGDSLGIDITAANVNINVNVIEFDTAGSNIKCARALSLSSGNNTVYTCPSGKTAMVLNSNFLVGGQVGTFNFGTDYPASSVNFYWNAVSSGGSPASTNQLFKSTAQAQYIRSANSLSATLGAGDFININVSTGSTNQWAFVPVIEW